MIGLDSLVRPGRPTLDELTTPFMLLDPSEVIARYREMRRYLPLAALHYAVKANAHPAVLAALAAEGCGFEIVSMGELRPLIELGVAPARVVCSNPVKTPELIAAAHAYGMDQFAIDSVEEVRKLARLAPGARVRCRVTVDNSASAWPLARKFGCAPEQAVELLIEARDHGLRPDALTFHVGSQCRRASSWRDAIAVCAGVWRRAARQGIELRRLDLGGGYPVQHATPVPGIRAIAAEIRSAVDALLPPGVELTAEPGRALVGTAGTLVASVIGKAVRGGERWLYLDLGVFNGLMETIEGFRYEVRCQRAGPLRSWTVAGPSCDSIDVMFSDVELPEMEVGDRIELLNAGAYTLSYASHFNGFAPPAVHLVGTGGATQLGDPVV